MSKNTHKHYSFWLTVNNFLANAKQECEWEANVKKEIKNKNKKLRKVRNIKTVETKNDSRLKNETFYITIIKIKSIWEEIYYERSKIVFFRTTESIHGNMFRENSILTSEENLQNDCRFDCKYTGKKTKISFKDDSTTTNSKELFFSNVHLYNSFN